MSLKKSLKESAEVLHTLAEDAKALAAMEQALDACTKALSSGKKLLFCGNGGSAADCQHAAVELVGRFRRADRRALAAVALTTDTSILTAIGNDFGFEEVFARQLEALGEKGDVLFALSTSGDAENVLRAATVARKKGLTVVGMTGREGGRLKTACDVHVGVPSDSTPRVQECHEALLHALCMALDEEFAGGKTNGDRKD